MFLHRGNGIPIPVRRQRTLPKTLIEIALQMSKEVGKLSDEENNRVTPTAMDIETPQSIIEDRIDESKKASMSPKRKWAIVANSERLIRSRTNCGSDILVNLARTGDA